MTRKSEVQLIGIVGRAGAGKDTFATMLQDAACRHVYPKKDVYDSMSDEDRKHLRYEINEWKEMRFAGELKEFAAKVLGVFPQMFENREYKDSQLGAEWGGITVRRFLEETGMKLREVNKAFWINALFAKFHSNSLWMICDTRLLNEAEAIQRRGGKLIHITGRNQYQEILPSEKEMDYIISDYLVDNSGDKEGLWKSAIYIAEELNLKPY